MINQKDIQSNALINLNMYFENIFFQNTGKIIENNIHDIEIGFNEIHDYKDKQITIKLFCTVKKNKYFSLNLCLVGIFLVGDNYPTDRLLPNAIAIMFPYLRSQVTIMTSQLNTVPVVIPAININSFLKKQNENPTKR